MSFHLLSIEGNLEDFSTLMLSRYMPLSIEIKNNNTYYCETEKGKLNIREKSMYIIHSETVNTIVEKKIKHTYYTIVSCIITCWYISVYHLMINYCNKVHVTNTIITARLQRTLMQAPGPVALRDMFTLLNKCPMFACHNSRVYHFLSFIELIIPVVNQTFIQQPSSASFDPLSFLQSVSIKHIYNCSHCPFTQCPNLVHHVNVQW